MDKFIIGINVAQFKDFIYKIHVWKDIAELREGTYRHLLMKEERWTNLSRS